MMPDAIALGVQVRRLRGPASHASAASMGRFSRCPLARTCLRRSQAIPFAESEFARDPRDFGERPCQQVPGDSVGPFCPPSRNQGLLKLSFWLRGGTLYTCKCYHPMLSDAPTRKRAGRSDISDHLGVLFYFATIAAPRLIVELELAVERAPARCWPQRPRPIPFS